MFRFIYSRVFCFICRRFRSKREEEEKSKKAKSVDLEPEGHKDDYMGESTKAQVIDDDEDDEDDDDTKARKTNVPLFVVLCVFFGYMVFGGWLFTMIETWKFVVGIYFSFISLGTIGNSNWPKVYLVCRIYIDQTVIFAKDILSFISEYRISNIKSKI